VEGGREKKNGDKFLLEQAKTVGGQESRHLVEGKGGGTKR